MHECFKYYNLKNKYYYFSMMNLFKNCNFLKISKFSRLHVDLIKTSKMGFAKIETIRKSINSHYKIK